MLCCWQSRTNHVGFTNLSSRCILMRWLHYWEAWSTVSAQTSPHIRKIIAQTSRPIINSFGTNSKDRTDDLIESVLLSPTPSKPSHSAAIEMGKLESEFVSSVLFWRKNDFSCLKKMSPPTSCVLFKVWTYIESHKGNFGVHIRLLHFLLEFIVVVLHFSHPLAVTRLWGSHFEVYGALGNSTGL